MAPEVSVPSEGEGREAKSHGNQDKLLNKPLTPPYY